MINFSYIESKENNATESGLNNDILESFERNQHQDNFDKSYEYNLDQSIENNLYESNEDNIDESNEDFEDYPEIGLSDFTFSEKLSNWALQHNITYSALRDLLKLLRTNEIQKDQLPKDPRTLLKVSSEKVLVAETGGGEYWHFGFYKILSALDENNIELPTPVSITANIDGVQVCKSSRKQFWPILIKIKGLLLTPIVVGIFYGNHKPNSLEFLNNFVEELCHLITNRHQSRQKEVSVSLDKFSLDVPAMSLIKGIKGHAGYFSCGSCTVEGEYSSVSKCIGFAETNCQLRTDSSFRDFYDKKELTDSMFVDHHSSENGTPLLRIPNLDMVKSFPRDSMHLHFLGISKKMISFWVSKPCANKAGKLRADDIVQINLAISEVSKCFPRDFNRKGRLITEFHNWKATEHRSFVLYTSLVVLKNIIDIKIYEHFKLFCVATFILSSKKHKHLIDIAEEILEVFIQQFSEIYGAGYCSYNVHNLSHIAEDCRNFGVLDDFSCFEFENKLGWITRLLKSGFKPLQQTIKKVQSQFHYELSKYKDREIFTKPILEKMENCTYSKISMENFVIQNNSNDQWILNKKLDIISFKYADKNNNLYGKIIPKKESFFEYPINSEILYIYESDGVEDTSFVTFKTDEIFAKLFRMNLNSKTVFFPLLHTIT